MQKYHFITANHSNCGHGYYQGQSIFVSVTTIELLNNGHKNCSLAAPQEIGLDSGLASMSTCRRRYKSIKAVRRTMVDRNWRRDRSWKRKRELEFGFCILESPSSCIAARTMAPRARLFLWRAHCNYRVKSKRCPPTRMSCQNNKSWPGWQGNVGKAPSVPGRRVRLCAVRLDFYVCPQPQSRPD